jgi:hypothetical protein
MAFFVVNCGKIVLRWQSGSRTTQCFVHCKSYSQQMRAAFGFQCLGLCASILYNEGGLSMILTGSQFDAIFNALCPHPYAVSISKAGVHVKTQHPSLALSGQCPMEPEDARSFLQDPGGSWLPLLPRKRAFGTSVVKVGNGHVILKGGQSSDRLASRAPLGPRQCGSHTLTPTLSVFDSFGKTAPHCHVTRSSALPRHLQASLRFQGSAAAQDCNGRPSVSPIVGCTCACSSRSIPLDRLALLA